MEPLNWMPLDYPPKCGLRYAYLRGRLILSTTAGVPNRGVLLPVLSELEFGPIPQLICETDVF